MKNSFIILVIIYLSTSFYSFGQTSIQQINSPEFATLILEPNYISSITQLGNNNSARLNQTLEGNLLSLPNTANSYQQGNDNSVDIFQKGSENVLYSFQLGYLISGQPTGTNNVSQPDAILQNMLTFTTTPNNLIGNGNNNTLISSQLGNSNNILTIQQGNKNYIEIEQSGNNEYLTVQQVGNNNRVENFKQTNSDGKSDAITQLGENNTFNTTVESVGNIYINKYLQEGSNLSVTFNDNTQSTLGGINVTQTGHDMKVVIDQSFFSFPLK